MGTGASELKQIKECGTSREVWLKLESVYQSKGPARKAALLKQLTTTKMQNDSDVRKHLRRYFDTVDKLHEIGVEIDQDLLSTLLLISLPSEFDNFRCAIESRDELPTLEVLRVKVMEEANARQGIARDSTSNAMFAKRHYKKPQKKSENPNDSGTFKYKCHKCKKIGHKVVDCKTQKTTHQDAQTTTDTTMLTSKAYSAGTLKTSKWCLDSGATSHFCNKAHTFDVDLNVKNGKLNLANKQSTQIKGEGTAVLNSTVNGENRCIRLENSQFVPDLRANLLSVSRITDHGFDAIFDKKRARVLDRTGNVKLVANKINGLYIVEAFANEVDIVEEVPSSHTAQPEGVWHRRFGHLNIRDLREGIRHGRMKGARLSDSTNDSCKVCLEGKMARSLFPVKSDRETKILKDYVNMIENQTGRKIKVNQSDNGREFVNADIDDFLKER